LLSKLVGTLPASRRSSLAAVLIRIAIVVVGTALVVGGIVGVAKLTGQGNSNVNPISIGYDFEPKAGPHGGTVSQAVKSDLTAFGGTSQAIVSQVADKPALACYLVWASGDQTTISLVEVDGQGAGTFGGVSRWQGNSWSAAPGRSSATQCEPMVPRPGSTPPPIGQG
jgi:hypothetical protein